MSHEKRNGTHNNINVRVCITGMSKNIILHCCNVDCYQSYLLPAMKTESTLHSSPIHQLFHQNAFGINGKILVLRRNMAGPDRFCQNTFFNTSITVITCISM
jgi:hypothetical protein